MRSARAVKRQNRQCSASTPEDLECKPQPPRPAADGCGKELDHWFTGRVQHTSAHLGPSRPHAGPRLSELPAACRQVLQAPSPVTH